MYEFKPEKVKELRTLAKMSQKELAKQLGVSDRAISKWEKNISKPSGEHMFHLSKIFNVPIEYFVYDNKDSAKLNVQTGMESLTELYKVGRGPSSSHTIGPEKACKIFKKKIIKQINSR